MNKILIVGTALAVSMGMSGIASAYKLENKADYPYASGTAAGTIQSKVKSNVEITVPLQATSSIGSLVTGSYKKVPICKYYPVNSSYVPVKGIVIPIVQDYSANLGKTVGCVGVAKPVICCSVTTSYSSGF